MAGLSAYADSVAEEFGCKSCLYIPNCEESFAEHEQKVLKAIRVDELDNFSTSENGDLMVQELGIALSGILHVSDVLTSNRDGIRNPKEMLPSLDTNMLKDLSKCSAILCSEVVQSYPLTFDGEEGLSSTIAHIDTLLRTESPTHTRSMTPPTTPKPVSAIKGSRAQLEDTPSETRLSVRWAPEVYDPPVTSDSHTVKGGHHHHHHHHHHSKAKKEPHKHGHNKIKSSSRGIGADRKHADRRSKTART